MCLSSVCFRSFVNGEVVLPDSLVPYLNNSTLGIGIPAEFKITLVETPPGPPVPATACLNLAIQVVGEHLALEEFTEKIGPRRWSMFDVVISTSTKGIVGDKVERRFVVWGIYYSLELFERQKNFRAAIFTLAWRGDPVGYLAIYPEGLKSVDASFNSPPITSVEPQSSAFNGDSKNSVSSSLNTSENRELVLSFGFLSQPRPLDLRSTLLTILSALCYAAQWPKNKVVPGRYLVRAGPSSTAIDVQPEKILNFKWLIKALTMIPEELRNLEDLRSFWVKIWFGTLRLGLMEVLPRGRIPHDPNAFIETGFNVSIGSATARER